MVSDTRTKITSWLKSPKTLAVKVGIGAVIAVAAGVPVASALIIDNQLVSNQNNAITAESEQNNADPAQNVPESADLGQNAPETAENTTPDGQNPANGNTTPANTPEQPAEPPKPVYVDTYPWSHDCKGVDTWFMTKCQSTSYTAWKVNEAYGNMPRHWPSRWPEGATPNPNRSAGDAVYWALQAAADNIPTGSTPKVGSVGVTLGGFGWTAWVEAVNGNTMTVSYYNWEGDKSYHVEENVPINTFPTYIYFGG